MVVVRMPMTDAFMNGHMVRGARRWRGGRYTRCGRGRLPSSTMRTLSSHYTIPNAISIINASRRASLCTHTRIVLVGVQTVWGVVAPRMDVLLAGLLRLVVGMSEVVREVCG